MTENYQLQWTVEVKETYRVTVPEDKLPHPVQYALSQGFDLDEIACGCSNRHLNESGGDVLDQAFKALQALVAEHQEEPDTEEVTDRDVVAFSAVPRLRYVEARPDPIRDSPRFWVNEHSDLL